MGDIMFGWISKIIDFIFNEPVWKRCPNCEGSFSKNGEGDLIIMTYFEDGSEEPVSEDELTLCCKCLENKEYLNKEKIKKGLQERGMDEEYVDNSMDAIDRYLAGEISYDTIKNPS